MEALISSVTAFVTQHGAWAGPIVGILAFAESMAVIGLAVPATTVMIAIGGLVGSDVLEPVPILVCATIGAILGDWLSFAIGRRIGPSAYRRWPLNRHRTAVARSRLFFRKYGFASIFLGRFLGPIRATIPLVAGIMEMDRKRFQLANVSSAVVWVPGLMAPGFLAARSMATFVIDETHIAALGLALLLMTIALPVISIRLLGRSGRRRRPTRLA